MKRILERWPRAAAVALGCVLALGPLAGLEGFFRVRVWLTTPTREAPLESNFFDLVEPEPAMGFVPKASAVFDETLTRGGTQVYRVRYSIDEHHRRITPVEPPQARPCVALFFGCSFTFGMGVNDGETLAAQFGRATDCFLPINYGFSGYGPQSFWVKVQDPHLPQELPNKRGVAIYTFIYDHLNRLAGAPGVVATWGARLPWLEEENGRIVQRGLFSGRRPVFNWLLGMVWDLHLYRFVKNHLPQRTPDSNAIARQFDFTARVLIDAANKLHERLPDLRVCFVVFPGEVAGREMVTRLAGSPILCLDYADLPGLDSYAAGELHIADGGPGYPGHPSPLLYRIVAERLARDIPPALDENAAANYSE